MPSALPTLLAALLLPQPPPAAPATAAADVRPAVLQVGIQVLADCRPGRAATRGCPAWHSSATTPAPAQVQALSPPLADAAGDGQAPDGTGTVTY